MLGLDVGNIMKEVKGMNTGLIDLLTSIDSKLDEVVTELRLLNEKE